MERRAGINLVQGHLVLLVILSFVSTLPSLSGDRTFTFYYGVLLLLLATKIADQRLVLAGVIATVVWLSPASSIVCAGYSLVLFIAAALILGCIRAPEHLRDRPTTRS